jgi:lipopolysaccharide transport system permease protein
MSNLPVTVYTPDSSLANPLRMLGDMFRDLGAGRELAWRLAVRDISAQYRQTLLGFVWAFIGPVANTIVWVFLSGSGVITLNTTDLPYPVYVFIGTMLWGIFTDALNTPSNVTNSARSMLAKINFPREALILSGIYINLFNAAIKMALLLGVPFYLGIKPTWSLLLFPLGVLSLILIGNTIGLLLTPLGMLYTDIGRITGLGMQFLFYITPAVFPMPKESWAALIFKYNPLTPLIETARDWLTGQAPNFLDYYGIVMAVTLILLLFFWAFYRLSMPIIIERMSS